MDREIQNLTKELNEQKNKHSQIEKLWIQSTREAMSDQRQFQQYETAVSDLKDRIGVSDIAKQKMQEEVESVKKSMSEVQVLYNLALLEVKKTKEEIVDQRQENLRLKSALEDYRAQFECKAAELKHDTEGFKTEIHIAQSTISELKKSRENLMRELSQAQAKMALQKDMITARSADQNETDKRFAELNVQVAHLTRQLQEASRVNATLSRHIEKNLAGYAQNPKTRLSRSQEDQISPQSNVQPQTQDKLPPLDRMSRSTANLSDVGTSLTPRPPASHVKDPSPRKGASVPTLRQEPLSARTKDHSESLAVPSPRPAPKDETKTQLIELLTIALHRQKEKVMEMIPYKRKNEELVNRILALEKSMQPDCKEKTQLLYDVEHAQSSMKRHKKITQRLKYLAARLESQLTGFKLGKEILYDFSPTEVSERLTQALQEIEADVV